MANSHATVELAGGRRIPRGRSLAVSPSGRDAGLQGWINDPKELIRTVHVVRSSNAESTNRYLSCARESEPTYQEVGASMTASLPVGFHHVIAGKILGQGFGTFSKARLGLQTWQAHQFNGVRVFPANTSPTVGATFVVTLGFGFASIAAPCRIVAFIEEPKRYGFAYGTLPGHPEQGEEFFAVSLDDNESVRFDIRAFSRPSDTITRLAGPLGRQIQSIATKRYLRSMNRFVNNSASR